MTHRNRSYEEAPEYDGHYTVSDWPAVAWYVLGWETEPDADTEWSGYEVQTGRLLVTMVGDDAVHTVDPDDLTEIDDLDYCAECGLIGCGHDGRSRASA